MTRIAIISREEMNEEQGAVYDESKAAGRPLGGPYYAYIRIPELMKTTQLVTTCIGNSSLSKREQQIAILTVARFWGADYPWAVQVRGSVKIGIEQEIIDAINNQQTPSLSEPREILAYKIASELLNDKSISDATYDAASTAYTEEELVMLVARVGAFSMTCCTANAFDVTPPEGAPARLIY